MAWTGNFKTQIEDLAGTLTATDDAATQQWILDGCYDVLRKTVDKYGSEELFKFSAKSTNQTSNAIDIDEIREITGVFRNGVHAVKGAWHLKAKYADSGSIYAATANDPVWYIDDSTLNIYPAPDGSNVANYYYIPEYSITNWDSSTSSINHYPSEYYYYAMLYASIKVLFRKLMDKSAGIAALDIQNIISEVPGLAAAGTIATVSYSAPSTTTVADVNEMLVEDIVTVSDASLTNASSASSNQPGFTQPTLPSFPDVSSFLTEMNNFIDSEEDTELASSKAQEINLRLQDFSTELQRYQSEVQSNIQEFEEDNTIYQALLQQDLQNVQAANQTALQNMQKDLQISQANLQKSQAEASTNHATDAQQAQTNANLAQTKLLQDAIQTTQAIIANNNAITQEHQSNLSQYQMKMDREVQEYQANLEKDRLAYDWIEKQYAALKQEYYMEFAPVNQGQPE